MKCHFLFCVPALLVHLSTGTNARGNPIRKVVSLMQNMQKEVQETGEKEKELFDKFMCFCENGDAEMKENIVKSSGDVTTLNQQIPANTAEKTQVAIEIKQHEQDKDGAQKDLAEAQSLRDKEVADHKGFVADMKVNINGVSRAIPAIEQGMSGAAFLQMPGANVLANLLDTFPFSDDNDRRELLAFVQQSEDYAPASGQIVGILKGMKDTMQQQLAEAMQTEAASETTFDELKSSKESEVQAAVHAISSKTTRTGELAVSIAQGKGALADAEEELAETQRLAEELAKQCSTKEKEWDERQALRAQEIQAISEAIGMLNNDDALDTFKKALPSSDLVQWPQVSFLQRSQHKASDLVKAQTLLAHVATTCSSQPVRLMLFSLSSKIRLAQGTGKRGADFSEIIAMIDDMVGMLVKNQENDDSQRDYCRDEFHKSDGEEKDAARELDKLKNLIEERNDQVAQLAADITALGEEIKALDKAVAVATEQRKEEHVEFVQTANMNQAALRLVEKAKNRLNKFYNPSEYTAPPTTTENPSPYGFVQVRSRTAQAPDFGEYEKGSQSTGVIMMMEQIVHDIQKDLQEGAADEKDAQAEYTQLMEDSQANRAQDAKSITRKEATKASIRIKIENDWERRRSTEDQLALIQQYIRDLHSKCDFLMKSFDERKEGRDTETQSLTQAKQTLMGATNS